MTKASRGMAHVRVGHAGALSTHKTKRQDACESLISNLTGLRNNTYDISLSNWRFLHQSYQGPIHQRNFPSQYLLGHHLSLHLNRRYLPLRAKFPNITHSPMGEGWLRSRTLYGYTTA